MRAKGGGIFAQEAVTTDTANNTHLFQAVAAPFSHQLHGYHNGNEHPEAHIHQCTKKLMRQECSKRIHSAGAAFPSAEGCAPAGGNTSKSRSSTNMEAGTASNSGGMGAERIDGSYF